jgi:hypothetical protein
MVTRLVLHRNAPKIPFLPYARSRFGGSFLAGRVAL